MDASNQRGTPGAKLFPKIPPTFGQEFGQKEAFQAG
jgi:hypothetical protein